MLRACPVCDVQYDADPGRLKHNRQTTCSRKCSYQFRAKKTAEAVRGRQSPFKGVKTGRPSWNRTAGVYINCGHCGKEMRIEPNQVGRKKFCSKSCFFAGRELKGIFQKGHIDLVPPEKRGHSDETRRKIAEVQRSKDLKGEKHFNWKGGKRSERQQEMGRYRYRDWRNAVFARDNWTCQLCNVRGGYLEADHIKPWCAFPDLRYDVGNGRTLCKPCHVKLDTHGPKALKYKES